MTEPLQAGVDHAELRRLAEAATPGPWYLRTNRHTATNGNQWGWLDSCPPGGRQAKPDGVAVTWEEGCQSHSNARYIAAANPAVMVALLNEIDALRAAPVLPDRGWRPDREAVARLVAPKAWAKFDRFPGYAESVDRHQQIAWSQHLQPSLKAADTILALPDAPAEGGVL